MSSSIPAVAKIIREVFSEYDREFCPMSLDEAYLDITDFLMTYKKTPGEVVNEMRSKIFERTSLTASAGISFNTVSYDSLNSVKSTLRKPSYLCMCVFSDASKNMFRFE